MMMNFTTPIKIAEALACGVPVVTTDIIEHKIWYNRGIYTYTTHTELENLIKQLSSKMDEIKMALCKYSHRFREIFSWDRLAENYEVLIEASQF
jgi:glycosyltransferase involved in cell wall biosynthesis